jgi:hypothetical protein
VQALDDAALKELGGCTPRRGVDAVKVARDNFERFSLT